MRHLLTNSIYIDLHFDHEIPGARHYASTCLFLCDVRVSLILFTFIIFCQ